MRDSEIESMLNESSDGDEPCSENEDHVEYAEPSDSSTDSDGEVAVAPTMTSKNGQIRYCKEPCTSAHGGVSRVNVISMIPGLTRYSCSGITEEEISSFQLFFPPPVMKTIMKYANIEGKRVFGNDWSDVDDDEMFAFVGLLLLAGVFRSNNESTESLWNSEKGRPIFGATLSINRLKKLSRVIRFDNRDTRSERRY